MTQVNTHVDAGNKLSISSGTDTTLKGAVASGKQVVIEVGTSGSGNLNIESLQDTSTYKSRQQSAGVSVSAGMGRMSGSLNLARSSVDGNYASVNEQSGIKAGDDGFQIKVAGNTDLKGAKIASTDKAAAEGKNSLTTGTLTQSDIQNRSDFKAESQSVGVGTGYSGSKLSMNGTGIGMGSSSGSESSTTRSGISQADVKITDDAGQQAKTGKTAEQTIASINTDVSSDRDTSGKITKTWNGQALQGDVEAQAQIMEMFGKNAAKAIGDYASIREKEITDSLKKATSVEEVKALLDEKSKWEEGGLYRSALHAAAGALAGGFDGALGATTASVAMPQIDKLIQGMDLPESLRQGLAQAVAAGLGGVVGGTSGLIAGMHVEANNRQLHKRETAWIDENKKKAASYLTEKLEREVSPAEAAIYLTLAGEGNVDNAYQRDNGNRLGSAASEERQLYDYAKRFISMNAVGSFTDDRGVTQPLFKALGNDLYDVKVNLQLRNDKEYRDFFWKTLGQNLMPDNPTTAERAEYDAREKIRLSQNLTQAGIGLIPAILAGITGRIVALKKPEPSLSQVKTPAPEPENIGGGKGVNKDVVSSGDNQPVGTVIDKSGTIADAAGGLKSPGGSTSSSANSARDQYYGNGSSGSPSPGTDTAGSSGSNLKWPGDANSTVVNAGFDTTNLRSKLEGYLLDVTHAQNQTKATWFQKALGFDRSNWQELASQITFNESLAVATKVTQYGKTFEQVLSIKGANGNAADVTFVFIKDNTGTVRLVTGIPTKK